MKDTILLQYDYKSYATYIQQKDTYCTRTTTVLYIIPRK